MDQNIFRNNYNAIINFINDLTSERTKPDQQKQIKLFINNFSFYTYFQFFQNEFMKFFVEDYLKNKEYIVFDYSNEISITNYLTNTTNYITIYLKIQGSINSIPFIFLKKTFCFYSSRYTIPLIIGAPFLRSIVYG